MPPSKRYRLPARKLIWSVEYWIVIGGNHAVLIAALYLIRIDVSLETMAYKWEIKILLCPRDANWIRVPAERAQCSAIIDAPQTCTCQGKTKSHFEHRLIFADPTSVYRSDSWYGNCEKSWTSVPPRMNLLQFQCLIRSARVIFGFAAWWKINNFYVARNGRARKKNMKINHSRSFCDKLTEIKCKLPSLKGINASKTIIKHFMIPDWVPPLEWLIETPTAFDL